MLSTLVLLLVCNAVGRGTAALVGDRHGISTNTWFGIFYGLLLTIWVSWERHGSRRNR